MSYYCSKLLKKVNNSKEFTKGKTLRLFLDEFINNK